MQVCHKDFAQHRGVAFHTDTTIIIMEDSSHHFRRHRWRSKRCLSAKMLSLQVLLFLSATTLVSASTRGEVAEPKTPQELLEESIQQNPSAGKMRLKHNSVAGGKGDGLRSRSKRKLDVFEPRSVSELINENQENDYHQTNDGSSPSIDYWQQDRESIDRDKLSSKDNNDDDLFELEYLEEQEAKASIHDWSFLCVHAIQV